MRKRFYQCSSIFMLALLLTTFCEAQQQKPAKKNTARKVVQDKPRQLVYPIRMLISTDSGDIIIKLSDSTPLHRDNFVKLVQAGFYDSLLFHRVVPAFMIQGGDPNSKGARSGAMLGDGGDSMTRIPAEFVPSLFHKKGALAAARDGNPEKASSPCQFYLVEGKTWTDEDLNRFEMRRGLPYTAAQRESYKTMGGTPHLDGAYTVFGEVESGIDVISKISHVPRDSNNRPLGDIKMNIKILY